VTVPSFSSLGSQKLLKAHLFTVLQVTGYYGQNKKSWEEPIAQFPFTSGRGIAQAVRRRLPIAVARVRAQVRSCGICGGQSCAGADFLRVLRFTLSILIPLTAPQSPYIIGAGTIGQLVADVPNRLSLIPPQENSFHYN
jgi:hypothetical protein